MKNLRSSPLVCFLVTAIFLTLVGCKLEIRVPQGGRVVSSDGAYICEALQRCSIDVVDLFFDETFVAEPAQGYSFIGWKEKDNYLCSGETGPCRLATAAFEGSPELQSLLESEESISLEPRFLWSPVCPDPELVISPAPPPQD
jgi:hypothetical protein